MAYTSFEELPELRKKYADKKIIFCSGCFDLAHAGHVLFFEDCKKQGDILVAMVGADAVIRRDKGVERPILNEHVRMKLIDSLKPVDYTFLDRIISPESPPLLFIDWVFNALRPDIYVVNNDGWNMPYREEISKKYGVELRVLDRACPPEFEKISTTGIIKKIRGEKS
jgi:D-beta-D-heptose 7-phosphate kinase/D-beta-D-heptose 1-phosphate adenosyltransferase